MGIMSDAMAFFKGESVENYDVDEYVIEHVNIHGDVLYQPYSPEFNCARYNFGGTLVKWLGGTDRYGITEPTLLTSKKKAAKMARAYEAHQYKPTN